MNHARIRENFTVVLNQLFPSLYFKWLTTRYCIINNMNIHYLKSYDPKSTFVTMWDTPPKYYRKWRSKLHLDNDGMPAHAPDGSNKTSIVPIVQYGITEYGYYINTGIQEHYDIAVNVADWLVKHQSSRGGWLYEYDYYHPRAEEIIKASWICGMAQGEVVAFLARMYHLTKNEAYRQVAEKALEPLTIPVEQGGVLRLWGDYVFYEEYPTQKPSLTINGFMYCLIGLHDYYEICNSTKAKELFDAGYKTLVKILPYYDSENTSYYDLSHLTNSPRKPQHGTKYDPLHVMLLQTLNLIKPDKVLRFYAEKWSRGIIKADKLKKDDAK